MTTAAVTQLPGTETLGQCQARVLRGLLAERRISGNALAHMTGLAQSTVSRRLTGEYPLDGDELGMILTATGVSYMEFARRVDREWAPRGSNPEPTD